MNFLLKTFKVDNHPYNSNEDIFNYSQNPDMSHPTYYMLKDGNLFISKAADAADIQHFRYSSICTFEMEYDQDSSDEYGVVGPNTIDTLTIQATLLKIPNSAVKSLNILFTKEAEIFYKTEEKKYKNFIKDFLISVQDATIQKDITKVIDFFKSESPQYMKNTRMHIGFKNIKESTSMNESKVKISLDAYKDACIARAVQFHQAHDESKLSSDEEEVIEHLCDMIAEGSIENADPMYVIDNFIVNADIAWSKEDLESNYDISGTDEEVEEAVEDRGGEVVDLSNGKKVYVFNWGF